MSADRLPAILQAMTDAAHEAGDVVLASALAAAVDLHALAPLLPLTGADEQQARGLLAIVGDEAWGNATACRAAARLASTAALLRAVDPTGHAEGAVALWIAAGRLASLPIAPEQPDAPPVADLSAHLAAADKRARDAGSECVRLNNELDKARKALADERRDVCAFLIESARQRQVSDWDSGAIERGEHVGAFARRRTAT